MADIHKGSTKGSARARVEAEQPAGARPVKRDREIEAHLRGASPRVLAALLRRYRDVDLAQEAVQEAMLAAVVQWAEDGVPDSPEAWLVRVASRRLIDQLRQESARKRREVAGAEQGRPEDLLSPAPDVADLQADGPLDLLILCCHPSLSASSQIALTLRAVAGLTTEEIARAFLVTAPTMARRISRAKQSLKLAGAEFPTLEEDERRRRVPSVLHVLYLLFNEGHAATTGLRLNRPELADEAIRLARLVFVLLPDDGEVAGLLALMLLTNARRAARTGADGSLVPLAEQPRSLWDTAAISEGTALITDALTRGRPGGPYQLQAAIAAVHAEARYSGDTDWPQIAALYAMLEELEDNPVVTLNRAVASAMVNGPEAGLKIVRGLEQNPSLTDHHRIHAVRAHLHEMGGEPDIAADFYERAASLTRSEPERHYLRSCALRLQGAAEGSATRGWLAAGRRRGN
jgi:RNA polymerase sigma factor (sigma-70 family)